MLLIKSISWVHVVGFYTTQLIFLRLDVAHKMDSWKVNQQRMIKSVTPWTMESNAAMGNVGLPNC